MRGAPPGHDAGDDVGVAAQPLGGRFDDEVDPELERLAEVGRGERVVDDHRGAVTMGELGQRREVGHDDARVGDGLGVEEARRGGRQRRLDGGRSVASTKTTETPETGEDAVHERARAAVHGTRGDDAVAGPDEREERGVDGRHAGAEGEARLRAVELGEGVGQGAGGRVLDARVRVAGPAEPDELGVVVDVLGVEGRRLVDGHRSASPAPRAGRAWRPGWRASRSRACAVVVAERPAGHPWPDSTSARRPVRLDAVRPRLSPAAARSGRIGSTGSMGRAIQGRSGVLRISSLRLVNRSMA